jgi:hypothetical protein
MANNNNSKIRQIFSASDEAKAIKDSEDCSLNKNYENH